MIGIWLFIVNHHCLPNIVPYSDFRVLLFVPLLLLLFPAAAVLDSRNVVPACSVELALNGAKHPEQCHLA
ncbi:MAG: hypothetical protein QWI73_07140 [Alphaproteobacteria bacterium]|nr:hypothetical protein [Alphaproteobacteria bacterium]